MKVFILEDDNFRIEFFKKVLQGYDLDFFDNVIKAEVYFNSGNKPDVLFFDHDLDNRIFVDSKEMNTGYQLALYLKEVVNYHCAQIIIHSMNTVGATNIKEVVKDMAPDVRVIPFHILMENF